MRKFWIFRLNKLTNLICFLVVIFVINPAFGQLEEPARFSEPYYLFPIKPGLRNSLSGTMGELRSSHFHTGLDIRTEGRTGLPVYSSADGYISRVAVSSTGYGNALYITHPNNTITVYAHLEKFNGPIAEYVLQEQYRRKKGEINLYFHKDRFSVKKGELIAYSGNSGSSQGAHLHYDIRDINNNPINPLEYGFNEIQDHTPPIVHHMAIKTLDKYARVNGEFGKSTFNVSRVGNDYHIYNPIPVYGNIGIELFAYDKLDNSRFRCGIVSIKMDIDGETRFAQRIDRLNFAKQRDILVHMDYKSLQKYGYRYHKLYVDDGNELPFYETTNNGKLTVNSGGNHKVQVTMEDSYGNISHLNFTLQFQSPDHHITSTNYSISEPQLIDNTLVIYDNKKGENNTIQLFTPDKQEVAPAYILNNTTAAYLWDMKDGLPYSVRTSNGEHVLNYKSMIPPHSAYDFYSENIKVRFPEQALFDTLYMQADYRLDSSQNQEIFSIGDEMQPLRKSVSVRLNPQIDYPNKEKFSVYATNNRGNLYYQGGYWSNEQMVFTTRSFGQFTIAADTLAPKISPIQVNGQKLMFKIWDDRSGIDSFECTVNGEWVLMHYDYKLRLIWSEKLNNENFKGPVKLVVKDNVSNIAEYNFNL